MAIQFQHFEVLTRPDGTPWELDHDERGVTYKARDVNLRSDVALRVWTPGPEIEPILREARRAAGLRHTNVASIYHLGEQDGVFFFAMEFVDGRLLDARLEESGKLPPAAALDIALQISRALSAAARQGLVHRDIRPGTLKLLRDDDGRTIVKIMDFGLAPEISAAVESGYASPERIGNGALDARSDIYALGATIFHMLTGHTPAADKPSREAALAEFDPPIRQVVLQMLDPEPAKRPQSANDLRLQIEACLNSAPATPAAPPASPPPLPPPVPNKSSALPIIISIVSVLIALIAAGWFIVKNSKFEMSVVTNQAVVIPPSTPIPLPQPTPEPPVAAEPIETVESQAEKADALIRAEQYRDALVLAEQAATDFPDAAWPKQKMEMIAALLRSNAFVMTPTKLRPLRPALESAAAMDVVSAQMLLGEELRESEPATALKWFRAAAQNGQTEAMTQTGLMLSNGKGVSAPDPALAVEWLQKAAAAGDMDATTALAECLIRGKGIAPDPKRAASLLNVAVAFDQPRAFNLLGDLYLKGSGVPQNLDEAARFFSRGAELGDGDSMAKLGLLYLNGQGVKKDPQKAAEIWKTGAERGFPSCMFNFAQLLSSGTGVRLDAGAAQKWFVSAARAGNALAIEWCRENKVEF